MADKKMVDCAKCKHRGEIDERGRMYCDELDEMIPSLLLDDGFCAYYEESTQIQLAPVAPKTYAIDFDGTLCESKYLEIGEPKQQVIDYVKQLKKSGCRLILWTCREDKLLDDAILWCHHRGIYFDSVNANLPSAIEEWGTYPRKVAADFYIDDKAVGLGEIERMAPPKSPAERFFEMYMANPPSLESLRIPYEELLTMDGERVWCSSLNLDGIENFDDCYCGWHIVDANKKEITDDSGENYDLASYGNTYGFYPYRTKPEVTA